MREAGRDNERVNHIIEAIENILEFVGTSSLEDFRNNKMMKHAIYRNFTIIGEAANLLTKEFRETHNTIEWSKLIGMRNVLVHGYYATDDQVVWQTIKEDLPLLQNKIISVIK